MGKKILLSSLVIACVALASITLLRAWSGGEDNWVCVSGKWTAHGRPSSPAPTTPCEGSSNDQKRRVTPTKGEHMITLSYQPKQCQETSWQQWSATSGARIKKDLSDAEIMMTYFQDQGINAQNASRIDTGAVVCQACDICPTSYMYNMDVPEGSVAKLSLLGWTEKLETIPKVDR